jgi:hypothetical protein
VSNAVSAVGSTPAGAGGAPAVGAAVRSIRSAIAAGSVTPDQAKGLVAVLVAMRAATGGV